MKGIILVILPKKITNTPSASGSNVPECPAFDEEKNLVTDVRYSMLPNQIEPMWGLVIDKQRDTNAHAIWWTGRELDQGQWDLFIEMLRGNECKNSSLD